jgi:hypothetical protein
MSSKNPYTDYSYMAGLVDGEGCIRIVITHSSDNFRPSPQYQLVISIDMTSLDCLKKAQGVFGGKITSRDREGTNFRIYHWHLFSQNASDALKKMLPYLQEKKQQAITGIDFQKILKHCSGRKPLTKEEIADRHKYFLRIKEQKTNKLTLVASKGLP